MKKAHQKAITVKMVPIFLTKEGFFMRYVNKPRMILFISVVAFCLLSFSLETEAAMMMKKEAFGHTSDGTPSRSLHPDE